jgi:hypothetical protein
MAVSVWKEKYFQQLLQMWSPESFNSNGNSQTKTRGQQLRVNFNSGEIRAACRDAKRSERRGKGKVHPITGHEGPDRE